MRDYSIVAEGLVKRYVTRQRKGLFKSTPQVIEALRGVSFKVRRGEVVGLLGLNGAGKTTTVKILATLLIPDEGDAWINGFHVVKDVDDVRRGIGVVFSVEKGFYAKLTGRENLRYFAALYGLSSSEAEKRVEELLRLLELDKLGASDRLFEEYSLGMKARLGLARALLRDPPVLILDEPTLGLDPPSARKIRSLVREMAGNGKTILYTTHNMFEAELVCDKILLIDKGRIIAEGTPGKLKEKVAGKRTIVAHVRGDKMIVSRTIEGLEVEKVSVEESEEGLTVRLLTRSPEEVAGILLRELVARGVEVYTLRIEEPTLEDVFIYFTSGVGHEGTT
ncbi:ABC transporter ATP-binding protein [Desulfurococcus amylolyticus]|uniref:ABC transporter related n=1 Tax=Desulfurococcus amylolyticus (strain DSM 18924 / JCM 16383 / VKM B-2413 / 1221n) TaxID=490899 RepID=B8D2K2_DESA1|nr:ABC transporter ATP-binding protein [Desulfurococcus amylolyticus]ACL10583.1 ABC transporter related [Desulfurococcus amylolyticus 1221n]